MAGVKGAVRPSSRSVEYFEPVHEILVPSEDFIRKVPLFGTHGIRGSNVKGFMDSFNSERGIGNGHFFFMTEDHRKLSPGEFAFRFRASLSTNLLHSLDIKVDEHGNSIGFNDRPAVILAVDTLPGRVRHGDDPVITQVDVWSESIRGFTNFPSRRFETEHSAIRGAVKATPILFDEKDERELNLAWRAHIKNKGISGYDMAARMFTEYYVYQKLAGKILRELEGEIRQRGENPKLPGLKS